MKTLTQMLQKLINDGFTLAEGREETYDLQELLDEYKTAIQNDKAVDHQVYVDLRDYKDGTVVIYDARDNMPIWFVR